MNAPRQPGHWRARVEVASIDIDVQVDSDDPAVMDYVEQRIRAMNERVEGFIEQELRRLLPVEELTWISPEEEFGQ